MNIIPFPQRGQIICKGRRPGINTLAENIQIARANEERRQREAHTRYREALMRYRYSRGHSLNQISAEFDANFIEIEIALGEMLTPADRQRVDRAFQQLFINQ